MNIRIKISSLLELRHLAQVLQKALGSKATVALIGELGAGKTTFAKFFLRATGIKKRVTSPTFVLMHRYKNAGQTYYHIDLYRTKSFKDVEALGIPETWNQNKNVLLIEWADKIKRYLPKNTISLKFKVLQKQREITILNVPPKIAKMVSSLYN